LGDSGDIKHLEAEKNIKRVFWISSTTCLAARHQNRRGIAIGQSFVPPPLSKLSFSLRRRQKQGGRRI
jgi:hypothetical protein